MRRVLRVLQSRMCASMLRFVSIDVVTAAFCLLFPAATGTNASGGLRAGAALGPDAAGRETVGDGGESLDNLREIN